MTTGIDLDGELARWLFSKYGRKDIAAIAQEIADELLAEGRQNRPPINLKAIFPNRKIKEYRIGSAQGEGRLSIEGDHFVIEIPEEGWRNRIRFTLAHEIAHTIFYDVSPPIPRRIVTVFRMREEEVFCNLLASAILMPSSMIQEQSQYLKKINPSIPPLNFAATLSTTFDVSFKAMIKRLVEDLSLLEGILIACRWQEGPIKSQDTQIIHNWRLSWFAVSPFIKDRIFFPALKKRPRVHSDILESVYQVGSETSFSLHPNDIKIGNLSTYLRSLDLNAHPIEAWIKPFLWRGIQLSATDNVDRTDIDMKFRSHAEIVIFIPINTISEKPNSRA